MALDQTIPVSGAQSLGSFQTIDSNNSTIQIEKMAILDPTGAWVQPLSEATGQLILRHLRENTRLLAKIANELPFAAEQGDY